MKGRITDPSSPCSSKICQQFRNIFSQKDSEELYIYLEDLKNKYLFNLVKTDYH